MFLNFAKMFGIVLYILLPVKEYFVLFWYFKKGIKMSSNGVVLRKTGTKCKNNG